MDLIERCQRGEADAFAELFNQYKNLVYRTAYSMLDDPREAEDALQEIFLRVHQSLVGYDSAKAAFSTWLYRVTINHCLNKRRGQRFKAVLIDSIALREHTDLIADDEREIRKALAALSEKLRTVIALRYYANLSPPEIAEVLNLPIGTVKSRLRQALENLRVLLQHADLAVYPFDVISESREVKP